MKKEEFKEKILDRWDLDIEERNDYIIHDYRNPYLFTCKICGYEWKQPIRFDRNMSCPNCHPINHGCSKDHLLPA